MAAPIYSQASDGLHRTEFFSGDVLPTIPGEYECSTGSGYVFKRRWDGRNWISPVNDGVSTVRMLWRGVVPGSADVATYPREMRVTLNMDVALRSQVKFIPVGDPIPVMAGNPNIVVLAS